MAHGNVKWPERSLLIKCAEVSRLCYKERDEVSSLKADWMTECCFEGKQNELLFVREADPPDVYHPKEERIYFGFRGTQISNFKDLIDDGNVLKTLLSECTIEGGGGKFHKGFKNRARRCWNDLFNRLKQLSEEGDLERYDLILCGHSLGGAAAAVSYIRMKTKRRMAKSRKEKPDDRENMAIEVAEDEDDEGDIVQLDENKEILLQLSDTFTCVTFGSPTFANEKNKSYCIEKKISGGIFHVINWKDKVPAIFFKIVKPWFVINARSAVGNFVAVHENGTLTEKYTYSKDNADVESKLKETKIEFDREFHKIKTYLGFLSKIKVDGNTELDQVERTNMHMRASSKPYIALRVVGEGSFGYVLEGKNSRNESSVAIKKMKDTSKEVRSQEVVEEDENGRVIEKPTAGVWDEIEALKLIKHANIVQLLDYFVYNEGKLYIIFEYCPFGSLVSFVETKNGRFKLDEIRIVLGDLSNGLKEIHSKNIIHRDIKPGNVLVGRSLKDPVYKLADLGSSTQYEGRTKTMTVTGTRLYMSPEIFQALAQQKSKIRLNAKTDIFSLGSAVLFCLKSDDPWTQDDLHDYQNDVAEGKLQDVLPMGCDEDARKLRELLTEMLQLDRHKRPDSKSVTIHPFLNGYHHEFNGSHGNQMKGIAKKSLKELRKEMSKHIQNGNCAFAEHKIENEDLDDDTQQYLGITRDAQIGDAKYYAASYNYALYHYNKALDLVKDVEHDSPEMTVDVCAILNGIANCYEGIGENEDAILRYKECWELCQTLPNVQRSLSVKCAVLNNLGCVQLGIDDSEAHSFLLESLMLKCILWPLKNYDKVREILNSLGIEMDKKLDIYGPSEQFDHTEYPGILNVDKFQEVLNIEDNLKKKSCQEDIAESLGNLGICYENQSQIEQGFMYHRASIAVLEDYFGEDTNSAQLADAYYNLGECHRKSQQPSKAISFYEKSYSMHVACKGRNNHPRIALVLFGHANALCSQSNYEDAVEMYNTCLSMYNDIYKEQPNHPSIMNVHYNYGLALKAAGKRTDAVLYWEKTLMRWRTPDNNSLLGRFHLSLARAYENQNVDKSVHHYKEYIESLHAIHARNPKHEDIGKGYLYLASCLERAGRFNSALEQCKSASDMQLNKEDYVKMLCVIGNCYANLAQFQQAIVYFQRALDEDKIKEMRGHIEASTLGNMGTMYERIGDKENALRCYETSVKCFLLENQELKYPSGIPVLDHIIPSLMKLQSEL